MLFGDVCNFVGNFSQYFLFSGCFWVVVWFELVGWGGVRPIIFLRGVEVAKMPIRWRNTDEMVPM